MAKAAEKEMPQDMSEKLKALEAARLQIEKQFGAGAIMKLGSQPDAQGVDVIPSGSILLDEAMLLEGRDVKDRASFVKKMNELLVIALKK